jgi:hypothetical protein
VKIKKVEKPKGRPHMNPPLIPGHVYQNTVSGLFYLGALIGLDRFNLFNLETGQKFCDDGFGFGDFIDVTEYSTFVVEI